MDSLLPTPSPAGCSLLELNILGKDSGPVLWTRCPLWVSVEALTLLIWSCKSGALLGKEAAALMCHCSACTPGATVEDAIPGAWASAHMEGS